LIIKNCKASNQLFFISFVLSYFPFFIAYQSTGLKLTLNPAYEAQNNDSIGFTSQFCLTNGMRFDDDIPLVEFSVTLSIAMVFGAVRRLRSTSSFATEIYKSEVVNR